MGVLGLTGSEEGVSPEVGADMSSLARGLSGANRDSLR